MKQGLLIVLLTISTSLFAKTLTPADPARLAHLEAHMWQAYYGQHPFTLLDDISDVLQEKYGVNSVQGHLIALKFATAAKKFRAISGRASDAHYRKHILPRLEKAYAALQSATNSSWSPKLAAKYELAWWVARRRRSTRSPEKVAKPMAQLYEVLYGKRRDKRYIRAAYLRAVAARYRDLSRRWQGTSKQDWEVVENVLRQSYEVLAQ